MNSSEPPARGNVETTLGYVGIQPSSYPINTIFLWTGGIARGRVAGCSQTAARLTLADFEEDLRRRFHAGSPMRCSRSSRAIS
jgi:hypothetical protein